jgi:hypothetical protein
LLISVKRSIMRKQTIRHKKPTQKLINSCPWSEQRMFFTQRNDKIVTIKLIIDNDPPMITSKFKILNNQSVCVLGAASSTTAMFARCVHWQVMWVSVLLITWQPSEDQFPNPYMSYK